MPDYLTGSVAAVSTPTAWPDPLFLAEQAMQLWPPVGETFMPTAAPGRPSKGMHVIRGEFDRRRAGDECRPSLREEAGELGARFRNRHPSAQRVTRKTIENNIRADYRTWKASSRQPPE
jgi:hypothetical protein